MGIAESQQSTLTGELARPYTDAETLEELYVVEGRSIREIGDILECDPTTVHYYLCEHGIERRRVVRIPHRPVPARHSISTRMGTKCGNRTTGLFWCMGLPRSLSTVSRRFPME